jgi:hypothetical protein
MQHTRMHRPSLVAFTALLAVTTLQTSTGAQGFGPCDRACLTGIAEQYISALVAKDPSKAPVATNVRMTDNGQDLPLGDGFWNSVSGRGDYTLHVADPVLGSVVSFVTMREQEVKPRPVLMAVRLKVVNRRITEIEKIVARDDMGSNGAQALDRMKTPRAAFSRPVPAADRVSRQELVRVANMYFSGMQLNDGKGKYPFGENCHRLENGMTTTNAPLKPGAPRPDPKTAMSYSASWTCREQFESGLLHFVSRIRDRRYVAVDEEHGLVVAFAFFDHDAGKSRHFTTPDGRKVSGGPQEPWTWHIAEVFKVEKGLLNEIEAVLARVPYGMGSGWSSRADAMSDRIQFEK